MKKRNLLILLFAVCGSLSSLMAQTSTVESNVFSLDTRLIFESNVFSVDTRDSYTVTFDLGSYATRSGGGALVQTVPRGEAATSPTLDLAEGWLFGGWSASFAAVSSDLSVVAEYAAIDSDNDGLSDDDEINSYYTDPNNADSDGDGLSDGAEVNEHSTNPKLADSNGDGLRDGDLVERGRDPNADYADIVELVVAQQKDLRIGAEIATVTDAVATLQIVLEESDDLSSWSERETIDLDVPLMEGEQTKFFRYSVQSSAE